MTSIRKALLFGFLVWMVPFLVSFCLFPLRQSNRPMFESLMGTVVALTGAIFLNLYFRRVERGFGFEGVVLGILWCAMSILFDLPLFLEGPMKMPVAAYFSDIGLDYLLIPAVSIPVGLLLDRKTARTA